MGATADDLVVDNYERVSVVATNGDVSGLGCLEVRPKGTVLLLR